MAAKPENWCCVESDPDVFAALLCGLGIEGIHVEEVYSMQPDFFKQLEPIFGLIFLYKAGPGNKEDEEFVTDDRLKTIVFSKQTENNTCATIAVLNIILNCKSPNIKLSELVTELKVVSDGNDLLEAAKMEEMKNLKSAMLLDNANTCGDSTEVQCNMGNYHYTAFVPIDGHLYELDGLKCAPIDCGPIEDGTNWTDVASRVILNRMKSYNNEELHINLLALVSAKDYNCES